MLKEVAYSRQTGTDTADTFHNVSVWPNLHDPEVVIFFIQGVIQEGPGMELTKHLKITPEIREVVDRIGLSPTRIQFWQAARSLLLPPNPPDPQAALLFLREIHKNLDWSSVRPV